jgi:hypothetical protein
MALKRLSTSFPRALMPLSLDVSLAVDDVADVEPVAVVLGTM